MAAPTARNSPHPPSPAAVLWDMDGTLVDTEPYWIAAQHEIVEAFGGTWSHDLAMQLVGQELIVSGRLIRDTTPVPWSAERVVDELCVRVIGAVRERVPWRPGALALLTALRDAEVPCALVTMSYADFAGAVVDALPAGLGFAAVVTGDVVSRGKPHPEPYLAAAAELGVEPRDCVAIEDSPTGVASAVAAGVPTLAVPHVVPIPAVAGAVEVATLEGLTVDDLVRLAGLARP